MEEGKRNSDARVAPSNGQLPLNARGQVQYGKSPSNGIFNPQVEVQGRYQGVYTYTIHACMQFVHV